MDTYFLFDINTGTGISGSMNTKLGSGKKRRTNLYQNANPHDHNFYGALDKINKPVSLELKRSCTRYLCIGHC